MSHPQNPRTFKPAAPPLQSDPNGVSYFDNQSFSSKAMFDVFISVMSSLPLAPLITLCFCVELRAAGVTTDTLVSESD